MHEREFHFLDPGTPTDLSIALMLASAEPADAPKGRAPAYSFAIIERASGSRAGAISLRLGDGQTLLAYAGHLGYRIDELFRGHHYAERACRLLAPLARAHGLTELIITCDPENTPSRRTCERLGAAFIEIVDIPPGHDLFARGMRRKCRYRWTCHSGGVASAQPPRHGDHGRGQRARRLCPLASPATMLAMPLPPLGINVWQLLQRYPGDDFASALQSVAACGYRAIEFVGPVADPVPAGAVR